MLTVVKLCHLSTISAFAKCTDSEQIYLFFQALLHHKKKSRSIIKVNSCLYLNNCHCQVVCVSKSAASNWCPHTRLLPLSLFLAKSQNFRESLFFECSQSIFLPFHEVTLSGYCIYYQSISEIMI